MSGSPAGATGYTAAEAARAVENGVGMSKWDLDTPALCVDLDALESNIATMQARVKGFGLGTRPHAKTHKTAAIAKLQLAAGALGICTAKVSEAEVLMAAGHRPHLHDDEQPVEEQDPAGAGAEPAVARVHPRRRRGRQRAGSVRRRQGRRTDGQRGRRRRGRHPQRHPGRRRPRPGAAHRPPAQPAPARPAVLRRRRPAHHRLRCPQGQDAGEHRRQRRGAARR